MQFNLFPTEIFAGCSIIFVSSSYVEDALCTITFKPGNRVSGKSLDRINDDFLAIKYSYSAKQILTSLHAPATHLTWDSLASQELRGYDRSQHGS